MDHKELEELQGMRYGQEAMKWYGWGTPVGLGLLLLSIGGFIYLLHLANILK